MADVITRLIVDSQDYDNKIKRAAQGLQHYADACKKAGGTLEFVDDEAMEFAKSLGKMQTAANTAREKVLEYNNAIIGLVATYREMTDAEKSGEFGKALAASIDELKGKAAQLKDIMSDTSTELTNLASDTSFTDGMGLLASTIGSCSAAITAWTGDSKEMEQMIRELAKITTTVNAVESLTKALQKQNLVLLKNPYVAAAAAVAALGVALAQLVKKARELTPVQKALNEVEQKGRENAAEEITRINALNSILRDNTRSIEDRKTALDEIQALVPEYHGALTDEGTLINDNTSALDDYITNLQRAATAQAAFDKMVDIQRRKMEAQLAVQQAQTRLDAAIARRDRAQNTVVTAGTEHTIVYEQDRVREAENALRERQAVVQSIDQEIEALQELINATDIVTTTRTGRGGSGSSGGGGGDVVEEVTYASDSITAQEKLVAELTKQWKNASAALRDDYKKELDAAQETLDQLYGRTKEIATTPINFNQEGIAALGQKFAESLSTATVGSSDYFIKAENLADLDTFQYLIQVATENGLKGLDFNYLSSLFDSIKLGADVEDSTWDSLVEQINAKLKELGIEPISIKMTVDSDGGGDLEETAKGSADAWAAAARAVNNLGGALGNLEDPSAKVAGIVMQAIANIALGFAQAAASPATGAAGVFGWIAAATAGLATMTATIASIKSVTSGSYASGGIIPGNHFSGDLQFAAVNAGEVVLNKAQTANLAGQLTSGGISNLRLTTELSGENIRIALSNNNRRRGGSRGEYAINK